MVQYKTRSELKTLARAKLKGHYGSAMLTCIMPNLITFTFSLPILFIICMCIFILNFFITGELVSETTLYNAMYIPQIFISIFLAMFSAGQTLFFLNLACQKRAHLTDIFFGFRWQFKKTLLLATVVTMASVVPRIPYDISEMFLAPAIEDPLSMPMLSVVRLILLLISLVGAFVSIPIILMLSQVYYLQLDFPKHSAKRILQLSIQIMKGNKWRLFCLEMSFLPLLIGSLFFTLGIGLLWVVPYMEATRAEFFLDLMNPQTQAGNTTSYESTIIS